MSIGNKKAFIDLFNKKKFKTIGDFKNGQSYFVIYKKPDSLLFFITGDDYNWQVDWRVSEQGLVFKASHLTGEVKERVINILNNK